MKLDENKKLTLTEEELKYVKRANMMASPSIAGMYLRSYIKNNKLAENIESLPNQTFYTDCILAYRKNNFEIC
jgi:hypothetical protein